MGIIYKKVLEFKKKYPLTIGWRIKQNAAIVENYINSDEKVLYAFIAQKNDSPFNICSSAVVVLTSKRILIGRKRVIVGHFLNSITPDMFNDLEINGGIIWGKVFIDTVKEVVTLTNISNDALDEIETEISSFMLEEKKKYVEREKEED
jgi:hypothetical protein